MTLRAKLSKFVARWVTPTDAAQVLSNHAMTLAERRAWVLADLKASVAKRKAVQG